MLSANDANTLNFIFNPTDGIPKPPIQDKEKASVYGDKLGTVDLDHVIAEECKAVHLAEQGQFEESEGILTGLIELCPKYASAYNNRAQVRQFRGNKEGAMDDLNVAIELAEDLDDQATLRQAHTQRGMLYKYCEKEDQCVEDFNIAAKLGSTLAKQELASRNPYAAMCNKMLSDVMQKYTSFHNENQ